MDKQKEIQAITLLTENRIDDFLDFIKENANEIDIDLPIHLEQEAGLDLFPGIKCSVREWISILMVRNKDYADRISVLKEALSLVPFSQKFNVIRNGIIKKTTD